MSQHIFQDGITLYRHLQGGFKHILPIASVHPGGVGLPSIVALRTVLFPLALPGVIQTSRITTVSYSNGCRFALQKSFGVCYWCYLPGWLKHWAPTATLQPGGVSPPFNATPPPPLVSPPFSATPPPLASLPAPIAKPPLCPFAPLAGLPGPIAKPPFPALPLPLVLPDAPLAMPPFNAKPPFPPLATEPVPIAVPPMPQFQTGTELNAINLVASRANLLDRDLIIEYRVSE